MPGASAPSATFSRPAARFFPSADIRTVWGRVLLVGGELEADEAGGTFLAATWLDFD